ncbi:MAG TPA: HIT domain-containing protein [Methylomirabilota bacterium]|nr:HIT domain-containing protein [Methylomirabilota bacterium]
MAYVASAGAATPPSAGGCIFCDALAGDDDRRSLVLLRSAKAFLILNKYPYASAHVMVALSRHIGALEEATTDELGEVMSLVRTAVRTIGRAYHPDGYNVGLNQGRSSGAGVPDHLHMHVVPRWSGDSNFMSVIAETRVLPESLDTMYDRLLAALGP